MQPGMFVGIIPGTTVLATAMLDKLQWPIGDTI